MGQLTTQPIDFDLRPATGETDQRLTVDATAGGVQFTAWGLKVTHILWTLETANVRFTLDASAPTSSNGHVLLANDTGIWPLTWAYAAKFIRTDGTSGVLHASPLTTSGT
jgi:hypothetical protein